MKRILLLVLCLTLAVPGAFRFSARAEETIVFENTVLAKLREVQESTAEAAARLAAYLGGSEETRVRAEERGRLLADAVRAAKRSASLKLTGDTDLRNILPLSGNPKVTVTLDLNGYVLYAPSFSTGTFRMKNGVAADLTGENDGGTLELQIEKDCTVLKDRNRAAAEFPMTGDLVLKIDGAVEGIRRLLYDKARTNKITITNRGTIWSDDCAVYLRAMNQFSYITLKNEGTVVGKIRGLDIHETGGNLNATGGGTIYGIAGPELRLPKINFSTGVTADDSGLDEETLRSVLDQADPYGDLDFRTGVAFDLRFFSTEYWNLWKLSPRVWASRAVFRCDLSDPLMVRGWFSPVIDPDSPSRSAECVLKTEKAFHELTGEQAERSLAERWKQFSAERFFQNGGTMTISVLCRYAGTDGKPRILFSAADTLWSRVTGERTGNKYTWEEAENGTLPSQKPVNTVDRQYQMKLALAAAGESGILVLDEDVEIQDSGYLLTMPENMRLEGDGHALSGNPEFYIRREAVFSGLRLEEACLSLRRTLRSGDHAVLDCGTIGELTTENVAVDSDGSANVLRLLVCGGDTAVRIKVNRLLEIDVTEGTYGSAHFTGNVGKGNPEAEIRITFLQSNFSKKLFLSGVTGAETIRVRILDKGDPARLMPYTGDDPARFYKNYLNMIIPEGLVTSDGVVPTVTVQDETGAAAFVFEYANGSWKEPEPATEPASEI